MFELAQISSLAASQQRRWTDLLLAAYRMRESGV